MAVIRVQKNKNYTVMSNQHLKNKEMSLKAKGLLSMMLSLPDDWDYSVEGLVAICKESETSVKSTLSELKELGYLEVIKLMPNQTETGRIEYVYNVFEMPRDEKQEVEKQGVENLGVEFLGVDVQAVENVGQLITNKQSIKKINTKEINTKNKIYYPFDEKLNRAFADYVDFRKKIRKPMTDRAIELAKDKLQKLSSDSDTQIEILNQSIVNGWQGLFPLKNNTTSFNGYSKKAEFDAEMDMLAKWAAQ
jgi:hypothetical protein